MIKRSKKVALVTGSSKGIGNNIADTLLANNYTVYTSVNFEKNECGH